MSTHENRIPPRAHSARDRAGRRSFVAAALLALSASACVSETVLDTTPRGPELLVFDVRSPRKLLTGGTYHGTKLVFEIDLENDIEPAGVLNDEKRNRPLEPIVPKIGGGTEIYELGGLYRLELRRALWHFEADRYPLRSRSRLYLFKEVQGDFVFQFRGRRVVVKSSRAWRPSLYYYYEEESLDPAPIDGDGARVRGGRSGRRQVVREVVQIGRSTIERAADQAAILVNGTPTEHGEIVLHGAVRKG